MNTHTSKCSDEEIQERKYFFFWISRGRLHTISLGELLKTGLLGVLADGEKGRDFIIYSLGSTNTLELFFLSLLVDFFKRRRAV